ncbi:type VI secretion system-associated FHA domain protein TagH [Rhodovulum sulfidophilum]|uniref:type VI secretion system-associated FHA domain protein TagH n=2 Tax=Rhodovulum sulfidophilum TaxID=35806 RepID=UPI00192507CC|nr:type VI secretion system-associated FHA domain protein TagH [Rhodovulum sulfidophilum]MBL3574140.1 type VI secretion system-associated FHA domain protein TagH [Rhodovulum sulfidophilum]MCE8431809.1 type VI secretion system-associated FHA domain protein TagH [Rhodovulum sulfidophilum]MCF4119297.1 type VI secretion system-associated FHA domain protein TagH [Rhodovulum sulfidophilum]
MMLILRIENAERLTDGSPAWIGLDGRDFCVGRRRGMDWVLPDPARHVSGHHFDLKFSEGRYWLVDLSTNGTFLEGHPHRLQAPHPLVPGDRFRVGPYVIAVAEGSDGAAAGEAGGGPLPAEDDPWDFGALAAAPVASPGPRPAPAMSGPLAGSGRDDGLQGFVPLAPSAPAVPGAPVAAGTGAVSGAVSGALSGGPAPRRQPSGVPPVAPEPQPFHPPGRDPAAAQAAPSPAGPDRDEAFLRAFCEGAGLDPDLAKGADAEALARDLGRVARVATGGVMRMLRDRASVKQFTRSGERTMRSASGNNPMKFLPDTDSALEVLFLVPRDGFLDGAGGFETALADLARHQQGIFAAIQPALAAVLDGLAPEAVEAGATGGNLLAGSRKARAWDTYVTRWDALAGKGENGMLDAFLEAFSEAYARAQGEMPD